MSQFLCAMLIGSAIFATGTYIGGRTVNRQQAWPPGFSPVSFDPDATSKSKGLSIATGAVDSTVEGVFILDHLTGNLQCWLMNARSGEIGGIFRGNVTEALGIQGKADPDFVMVTGKFDFSNFRQGNFKYAECICYVGESGSGQIAGFSFTYDPTAGARGQPQAGELKLITTFPFRDESVIRD